MDEKILYEGYGWTLKLESAPLPDGRVKTIARPHSWDTSHVLAETASGKILLLREYRPFFAEYVWMIPSGKIDKETDSLAAAQRELQEETGYRANHLEHFFSCNLAERIGYRSHVYLARDLVHDPLPQDATEMIEVHEMTPKEALEKVEHQPFTHMISALALYRYLHGKKFMR